MPATIPDLTDRDTWSDDDLTTLLHAVRTEQQRRWTQDNAETRADQLAQDYQAAVGRHDGDAWTQPTGAHDAYRREAQVTHGGKTWVSLVGANVWEPGVSGWREVTPESEDGTPAAPPEWVQPTGGHDAYKTGDLVTWQGQAYRSNRDGNVWSPSALPSGWDLVPTA